MSTVLRVFVVSFAIAIVASPAAGQPGVTLPTPPGWSLTPSLGASQTYDDNVNLQGTGGTPVSDLISTLNPSGTLTYNGPRAQLNARYDGSFLLYRSSTSLDSYAQNGSLSARRRLSARTSLFVGGSISAAPTTELVQLTAVPYVRTGSRAEDARVGIESAISKRL